MHHDTAGPTMLDRFGGELLDPSDPGYEQARRVFNGAVDRRPALIARCRRVDDVIAALAYARDRQLPVAVRAGGHGVAGHGVVDGGLVLDLRPMRRVEVDPARRRARVEGGATWAELDRATQAHGLAVTGGRNSTVGVAGVTLGGGSGWLERSLGPSCDHLVAAEVVSADGRLLSATEDEHPELLWALRGGGGNFGVVTCFTYRLHPLGPLVLGGLLLHPLERAAGLAAAWFGRDLDAGEAALRPLRAFGPPLADSVAPLPYTALQAMADPLNPPGRRHWWSAAYLPALSEGLVAALSAAITAAPGRHAVLGWCPWAGPSTGSRRTPPPSRTATAAGSCTSSPSGSTPPTTRPTATGCGPPRPRSARTPPPAPTSTPTRRAPTPPGCGRPTARPPMPGWPPSRRSSTPPTPFATPPTSLRRRRRHRCRSGPEPFVGMVETSGTSEEIDRCPRSTPR
jgi:FAD binding domain